MDLKSLLNESNNHKHAPSATQQPSPSRAVQHGAQHHSSHRALSQHLGDPRSTPSQPPPIYPPGPRSPDSYFPSQSPYPHNSASAPVANGGQWPAQSPAAQSVQHNTLYGNPPLQSPAHPSSSLSSPQAPGWYEQSYHSRHNSVGPIGLQSQQRHALPNTPLHKQPGTPLGPPPTYNRPSPQTQRPPSSGYEHHRTNSSSSAGSYLGQEHTLGRVTASPQQQTHPPPRPRYSMESERDRSESVSPKTIPQPLPPRQTSTESATHSLGTPAPSQKPRTLSNHSHQNMTPPEPPVDLRKAITAPPPSSSIIPQRSLFPQAEPSPPIEMAMKPETPNSVNVPTSEKSLKRTLSVISATSSALQPHKRLRRDEVPIFARNARQAPLKLIKNSSTSFQRVARAKPPLNGQASLNGNTVVAPPASSTSLPWEPSITNVIPYEDLTRRISDWIVGTIDKETVPSGGAAFEIEAKIGEIHDIEEGRRLSLPVGCETIFLKDRWRRTKFESSMDMKQHKLLNEFLNGCTEKSHTDPGRMPIEYQHGRETDQFFELNAEGISALPPNITPFLDPRHRPRVRITSDRDTLKVKARIIKSRLADIEVFNPATDFDYRISISLESPWEGNNKHLIPLKEAGMERNKDRVSYRHVGYQIDLTQVSYPDGGKQQHELEVEISTEQIKLELANLKAQRPSNYETLVKGFIDNVRILCRKGTIR